MDIKKTLTDALAYINHVGANHTMRGNPHPQEWLVKDLEAAIASMEPKPKPSPIKGLEDECPDGLLPDGPTCPACGGKRGPSGVGGGTWVHYGMAFSGGCAPLLEEFISEPRAFTAEENEQFSLEAAQSLLPEGYAIVKK